MSLTSAPLSTTIKITRNRITAVRSLAFTRQRLFCDIRTAIRDFTDSIDEIIKETFNQFFSARAEDITSIALGGYGRKELYPYSDIDLLILHNEHCDKSKLAALGRALWDLGLSMGCVMRTPETCLRILGDDPATDMAFLESRFLAGSTALFQRLENDILSPYFLKKKKSTALELRTTLRNKIAASDAGLYTIEPDLKNGVCALRDCHRIVWAQTNALQGRFTKPEESILGLSNVQLYSFRKAYAKLAAIRAALHVTAGRRLDVLEIALQPEVMQLLSMDSPAHLMEEYFYAVRTVKNTILSFLEHTAVRPSIASSFRTLGAVPIISGVKLLDGMFIATGIEKKN